VDETYLRVKGRWCYLYRAIDSAGATIDFLFPHCATPMPPNGYFATP
jgi:putative transposase